MNIFGALTFGGLIKTFLPGFVWLVAFTIFALDLAQWRGQPSHIIEILTTKDLSATLVLAFPVAILLGLLSNVVVFMGVNDWLVRNPVRRREVSLFALHDRLSTQVRDQCWTALGWNDAAQRAIFDHWIDPEVILVERLDVEKLSYVRE